MSGTGREARPPQARVLGDEWGETRACLKYEMRSRMCQRKGYASPRQLKLQQRTWVAIDHTGQECQIQTHAAQQNGMKMSGAKGKAHRLW